MTHLGLLVLTLAMLGGYALGHATSPTLSLPARFSVRRPDPVDDEESDREADRWERRQWGDR